VRCNVRAVRRSRASYVQHECSASAAHRYDNVLRKDTASAAQVQRSRHKCSPRVALVQHSMLYILSWWNKAPSFTGVLEDRWKVEASTRTMFLRSARPSLCRAYQARNQSAKQERRAHQPPP